MGDFPKVSKNCSKIIVGLPLLVVLLTACTLDTPHAIAPNVTPLPESTVLDGWTDANAIMAGICFESALDAADTVFVLRDETALINFFNLADNSGLCRRPVERTMFDFGDDRVLAGLWSYGTGCTAQHTVTAFNRDITNRTLTITLDFSTDGDCPYELIRPFWMGLDDVADYEVTIQVE